MCIWMQHQGKRVDVMATFARYGDAGETNAILLQDVYVAYGDKNYTYARDHVWLHGRTWCNMRRATLTSGDVIQFNAKVACHVTRSNDERRLGFRSVRNVEIIGRMR